jgi:hypothetical protein
MMKRLFFFCTIASMLLMACTDDEKFSADRGNMLTFSVDTLMMDTLFSTVPSSTKSFWVFNHSSSGIRISTARLERGVQSGFRVNVDGTFLNPVGSDFEVRKGDSIRVFVEVTTRENHADEPQLVEDNLLFTLESGVVQRVNLRTYSWDAMKYNGLVVRSDSLIESSQPIVIYDSLRVDSGCTLTILNTTLYFHSNAGIKAYGQLNAINSVFRGDRMDHMFDYLPYDRVNGQWKGIDIKRTSGLNIFMNCEIRNAMDGIRCDSTKLRMDSCKVHNSRGDGLSSYNSFIYLDQCQFTNSLGDCVTVKGGTAQIDHCTLAQFYPFSANRKAALRFSNTNIDLNLSCKNTLITGYEADVLMAEEKEKKNEKDTTKVGAFSFHFKNCILRTDSVDDERLENIIWETPKDSVEGKKHFRVFDEENLYYDFTIDTISPAFARGIGALELGGRKAARRRNVQRSISFPSRSKAFHTE